MANFLGRVPNGASEYRGRGSRPPIPVDPHLDGPCGHIDLCADRLADRDGADGRRVLDSTGDERDEHHPRFHLCAGLWLGRAGGGHCHRDRRAVGRGTCAVAVSRCLCPTRMAGLGAGVRPGQADQDGAPEHRHLAALGHADDHLFQLCLYWRAFRRCDTGGKRGADPVHVYHRLCNGRLCLCRRDADCAGLWARRSGPRAQKRADDGDVGDVDLRCNGAGLCIDRSVDHRSDGQGY
mmetsp:Transcript_22683/g.37258  ORF Transcript_22683/g.37258 Transcript_22683/m.37258 type:complete len:237 (+) Transcript_22683:1283-1993(+)